MKNKGCVVIVDDELGTRESLRMILKGNYRVFCYEDPDQALENLPPEVDIIFSDIKMMKKDGIQFLKEVKLSRPDIEVIMITAYPGFQTTLEALRYGAFDYIVKPFDKDHILEVTKRALKKRKSLLTNERLLKDLRVSLEKNYEATTRALISAVDAKDSYTARHCQRVAQALGWILEKLGISKEKQKIYGKVAELHDIGKIGISEHILNKPSSLTPTEFEEIKQHPLVGYRILEPVSFLKKGLKLLLHHHESYDGSGYPQKLKGEKIPYEARILAILDAYDAMTTDRCYRKKMNHTQALTELQKGAAKKFDPWLLKEIIPLLSHLKDKLSH